MVDKKKRGGRRSWPVKERKRFALLLYAILCERYGPEAPFERLKGALAKQRAQTRESTIRGWLPPLERLKAGPDGERVRSRDWQALRTPDLASLVEVSRVLDVSVDHLLGAAVPRRLSDREPLDNPAPGLLSYVVRDYVRRAKRGRRDGLAATVGGRLLDRQPAPLNAEYLAEVAEKRAVAIARRMPFIEPPFPDWPQPGDVLPDGRIVTNRSIFGLQLLDVDTQAFLARVCDRVFSEAEAWEENHKEVERGLVREHVRTLAPHAAEIATAVEELTGEATTNADILRRLLHVSQSPLSNIAQGDLMEMARNLKTYRERQRGLDLMRAEFKAALAEVLPSDEAIGSFEADEPDGYMKPDSPARP